MTLRADDLNAFGAARMVIGSTPAVLYGQGGNYVTFDITDGAQSIVLRNGAELAAPEVFLWRIGREAISLEQGAAIVTLGRGLLPTMHGMASCMRREGVPCSPCRTAC